MTDTPQRESVLVRAIIEIEPPDGVSEYRIVVRRDGRRVMVSDPVAVEADKAIR